MTGSFWFSAAAMAAAIATIGALRAEGAIEAMDRIGSALRAGIVDQAAAHGLQIDYTGPPAMPYLTFAGDQRSQARQRVRRRGDPGRGLPAPAAQLVHLGGDDGGRRDSRPRRRLIEAFAAVAAVADDNVAHRRGQHEHRRSVRRSPDQRGRPGERRGDPGQGGLPARVAQVAAFLLDVRHRLLDHLDHYRHLPELRLRPGSTGARRRSGPGRSSAWAT